MKAKHIFYSVVLSGSLSLTSCADFLDVSDELASNLTMLLIRKDFMQIFSIVFRNIPGCFSKLRGSTILGLICVMN